MKRGYISFKNDLNELNESRNYKNENNCVSKLKKGENDIAIGNVVGSNIFNILFVVGTSALIIPVAFVSSFIIVFVVMAMLIGPIAMALM